HGSVQYKELVEVVTRAVAKLKLDWPAKKPTELPRSKLDERFLCSKPPPPRQGLPFFTDLYTEVSRSEEWLTPHHTVPEIVLPTLPPMVFQGAVVSSKLISQHPPGNAAPDRLFPAGRPLQGTDLAALVTSVVSLERLIPLIDHLSAWKHLPNMSQWVLHTVEKVYRIQFGSPPPLFRRVLPTLMGSESKRFLRKEAIKVVPPHDRESGFYSWYFIVPKKDGGLHLILDLRLLNHAVMRHRFKMLTLKQVMSQIRSEDWFVTIDLKDTYFHISILPQHRKFLRFAFGGEAYQHRVLPFGLGLSPRTFTKCVDAALAPLQLQGIRILNYIDDWLILSQTEQMTELGLRLNAKKSVLSPLQRTTYLGVVWDSTTRVCQDRPVTVKQFQKLLALMAAASNVIPFGLLYMRPLQWWLRTKGFSPWGNPLHLIKVTRRCFRALD
ncbi:hypothetical protein M9458_042208, partial [Cirrhinus mrigala]